MCALLDEPPTVPSRVRLKDFSFGEKTILRLWGWPESSVALCWMNAFTPLGTCWGEKSSTRGPAAPGAPPMIMSTMPYSLRNVVDL